MPTSTVPGRAATVSTARTQPPRLTFTVVVAVTERRKTSLYAVERLPEVLPPVVAAWRFVKFAPGNETYTVSLADKGPHGVLSCECWGYLKHKRCRHCRAIRRVYTTTRVV